MAEEPTGSTPNPQPENTANPSDSPAPQATEASASAETAVPPDKDARTMAMLAHLLGIITFIGPLIIWLIKKDENPFIDDQGKEALNFQLTVLIGYIALIILSCLTLGLGSFLIPILWIISVIMCILAGVKANEGVKYRYPFTLRLIK